MTRRARALPWLVASAALLPHVAGLANGFVYDDFRFFVENQGVHSFARPWEFATSIARAATSPDPDIWRPLRTLLFASEHALFDDAAMAWHAVSLLLHLLLVRGVIALAARLPGMTTLRACVAGLLFGSHPLTVESVAWVSSQGDLLAALGVVVSLVVAAARPALSLAFAALALFGKESAVPLAIAVFAAGRCFVPGQRPRMRVALAALAMTLLYLVARQCVLRRGFDLSGSGFGQHDAGDERLGARLLQFCQNLPLLLERFVVPRPLSVDYDHALVGMPGIGDVLLTVAVLAAATWTFVRSKESRARAGFALLFTLLFFLPTSGLVAMKNSTAERFWLLPVAGLSLLVAGWLPEPCAQPASRRVRNGVAAALLVLFGSLSFARTRDFASDATLWQAEFAVHPASIPASYGLLHAAAERGDHEAVRAHASRVVALAVAGDPRRLGALYRLGEEAIERGDEARGLAFMQQCRGELLARTSSNGVDSELHLVYVALANPLLAGNGPADRSRARRAEELVREGIAHFGRRPRLLESLGVARDQQGDAPGAEALYREALALGEESATLHHHLALSLIHEGRSADARPELLRALTLDPGHVSSRSLLDQLSREPRGN